MEGLQRLDAGTRQQMDVRRGEVARWEVELVRDGGNGEGRMMSRWRKWDGEGEGEGEERVGCE